MDNIMIKEGKYTVETFSKEKNLTRQSAINLLSKLKKSGLVTISGGGKQKRIYTITKVPQKQTNGLYDILNKYSPEKLVPKFKHIVKGKYTIENALIDSILIGDKRTLDAATHLFRHISSWKRLFDLAKKHKVEKKLYDLYFIARKTTKVKKMPKRYLNNDKYKRSRTAL